MKVGNLFTLFILFFIGSMAFGQTISKDNISNNKGDTRAKGSYHLYKQGNNLKLDIKLDVRKSGMSGTGKGAIAFIIFNENFEPVFKINKGLTVGAKIPQGVNSKDWKQSLTFTGNRAKKIEKNGLTIAFNVSPVYDKTGMPKSLEDWQDTIKDGLNFSNDILDLTVGKSMKRGDWKFVKILATGN